MYDAGNPLLGIYNEIKESLSQKMIQTSSVEEIPYGIQFTISKFTNSGLLRVYKNKKGVIKIDYSQIKHEHFKNLIENIINEYQLESSEETTDKLEFSSRNLVDYEPVIGIDESGKGDYFGPLVTAAVHVSKANKILLDQKGVKDSKKINDNKIIVLSNYIKSICVNQFTIIEISPQKYNQLYQTFTSEGKKLNTLLAWAHAKSLEEVLTKVNCKKAISDQFADERFIQSKLQERGKRIGLVQQHKAESHTAVAAASILARARFLEKLKDLSEEVNMDLAKGASSLVVQQAKTLVEKNGREILNKVAKLHFKTTKLVFGD